MRELPQAAASSKPSVFFGPTCRDKPKPEDGWETPEAEAWAWQQHWDCLKATVAWQAAEIARLRAAVEAVRVACQPESITVNNTFQQSRNAIRANIAALLPSGEKK